MNNRENILACAVRLMDAYKDGLLGGEIMPEHENPGLDICSKENYLYFTLPMALNYQRNSYTLWKSANRLFKEVPEVFDCAAAVSMSENDLRDLLVKYKAALQPTRHTAIWRQLCETFYADFDGDVRIFFTNMGHSVSRTKEYICTHKKDFPYLGGTKICNYWLHVIEQYTDMRFEDRENISVAPDTHVIKASVKLGVISESEANTSEAQRITAARWSALLQGTGFVPIDMHTPLWLWSRGGFVIDIIS